MTGRACTRGAADLRAAGHPGIDRVWTRLHPLGRRRTPLPPCNPSPVHAPRTPLRLKAALQSVGLVEPPHTRTEGKGGGGPKSLCTKYGAIRFPQRQTSLWSLWWGGGGGAVQRGVPPLLLRSTAVPILPPPARSSNGAFCSPKGPLIAVHAVRPVSSLWARRPPKHPHAMTAAQCLRVDERSGSEPVCQVRDAADPHRHRRHRTAPRRRRRRSLALPSEIARSPCVPANKSTWHPAAHMLYALSGAAVFSIGLKLQLILVQKCSEWSKSTFLANAEAFGDFLLIPESLWVPVVGHARLSLRGKRRKGS